MKLPDTFPHWIYDGSEIPDPFGFGALAVEFLRKLKHPKSRLPGYRFSVDPWVERIILATYGPRYEADVLDDAGLIIHRREDRIVSELGLLLPRGNRKTSISAALALLHLFGPESVPAGEIIFAAGDRTQAGIAFREASGIIREDRRLAGKFRIHDAHNSPKKIGFSGNRSFLEAISADGRLQHGRTPTFVLADEIHIWPDRELWEALTTGLDKSTDTLLVVATTAGRGTDTLAAEKIEGYRKIARGEVTNPSVLPVLFEADADADWRDEKLWRAVNPGMAHGYPSLAGFHNGVKRAETSPAELESFKQLKLNIWQAKTTSPFIDMGVYDNGAEPFDDASLKHLPCWLGVDLSSNNDLTVISAVWRDEDGRYFVRPFFFCPRDNVDKRTAKGFPYAQWAKDNAFITTTEGSVIDQSAVEAKIRELCAIYNVRQIAFDPALAQVMMSRLLADDFRVFEQPQKPFNLAPCYQELERAVLAGDFIHAGHPVLRWNFENAQRIPTETGFIQISKKRSKEKIDGLVATAMAIGCAATDNGVESIFEKPDDMAKIYESYS